MEIEIDIDANVNKYINNIFTKINYQRIKKIETKVRIEVRMEIGDRTTNVEMGTTSSFMSILPSPMDMALFLLRLHIRPTLWDENGFIVIPSPYWTWLYWCPIFIFNPLFGTDVAPSLPCPHINLLMRCTYKPCGLKYKVPFIFQR